MHSRLAAALIEARVDCISSELSACLATRSTALRQEVPKADLLLPPWITP